MGHFSREDLFIVILRPGVFPQLDYIALVPAAQSSRTAGARYPEGTVGFYQQYIVISGGKGDHITADVF
jgi:hypothetical protein